MYSRLSSNSSAPLVHPKIEMTRRNFLSIARDKFESVRLTICAQDATDCSWILFVYISAGNEPLMNCLVDALGLMGYDTEGYQQEHVLQKIEAFLNHLAHRAILDMIRVGQQEEVAAMWYTPPADDNLRSRCDKVLCKPLLVKEKIDVGWAIIGPEQDVALLELLQSSVDKAKGALADLRRTQLRFMSHKLGLAELSTFAKLVVGEFSTDVLQEQVQLGEVEGAVTTVSALLQDGIADL